MAAFLDTLARNFAGLRYGHVFGGVPDFVDLKNKPGYSAIPKPTMGSWFWYALTLRHIWGAPNLVWGLIALALHFYAPVDLSPTSTAAQAPLSWAFFAERAPLWFAVVFGYTAYFHVSIYGLGCARRPFIAGRKYIPDKVLHNVFWSACGVAQWVCFENVFAFLWATGRLSYMSDAEMASSWWGIAKMVGSFIIIPLWRDSHFYVAHRLLHWKPLYHCVHSLHHRNQDIEPFAGLSMHPVEHLYYYACILPSLLPGCSPFFFLWNGIHLLLAPGASHSGYEDHFQADFFHYAHHRYFECNYAGLGAAALDLAFGTFVGDFTEREKDKVRELPTDPAKLQPKEDGAPPYGPEQPADAKSTLWQVPTRDFVEYLILASLCILAWAVPATNGKAMAALQAALAAPAAPIVALAVIALAAGALADALVKPRSPFLVQAAVAGALAAAATAAPLAYRAAFAQLLAHPAAAPALLAFIAGFGPVLVAFPWVKRGGGIGFEKRHAPVLHWTFGTLFCSVPIAGMAFLSTMPSLGL